MNVNVVSIKIQYKKLRQKVTWKHFTFAMSINTWSKMSFWTKHNYLLYIWDAPEWIGKSLFSKINYL